MNETYKVKLIVLGPKGVSYDDSVSIDSEFIAEFVNRILKTEGEFSIGNPMERELYHMFKKCVKGINKNEKA